jgi:hypothetical protein
MLDSKLCDVARLERQEESEGPALFTVFMQGLHRMRANEARRILTAAGALDAGCRR